MIETFELPDELAAAEPPERRGIAREQVRMLVAAPSGIEHGRFADLPGFLRPGDLVVVNTSATLAAAVDGQRADGRTVTLHFSTSLSDGTWLVELRAPVNATGPVRDATAGETVTLPVGVVVTLLAPHAGSSTPRLWRACVDVEGGVEPGAIHQ